MRSASRLVPSLAALALFCLSDQARAQNTFEITIPVPGLTNVAGGQQDPQGGFIFGGEVGDGLVVLRTDSTGGVLWTRQLAEGDNDEGIYDRSLAISGDRILTGGYAMGPNTATRDGLLHVLDLDGNVLAQRLIDVGFNSNAVHTVNATADGGLIAGRATGEGSYDMLLMKVDQDGVVQDSWSYGSTGWDWAYEAIRCTDRGMALVGYGDDVGGPAPSAYLVRTDSLGQELWARGVDGASADEGYTVLEDSVSGDLYIGGRTLGMGTPGTRGFITKFTASGTHVWTRVIGNAFDPIGIVPLTDGRFATLVRAQNIAGGHGDYDALLLTFNAQGDLLGNRLFGTTASEYPVSLSPTANGGLLITCLRTANGANGIYAVLTDGLGAGACSGITIEPGWSAYTPTIFEHTSLLQNGQNSTDWAASITQPAATRAFVCCTYPVEADFTAAPVEGLSWTFTDQSQGVGELTWNIAGDTFSGDTVNYTFTAPGTYQVCLTIEGICASDQLCEPVEVIGTGIGDHAAQVIRFSPNPATDRLYVTCSDDVLSMDVLDVHGRLLRKWPVNGARSLHLDVSGLPSGVLVLRTSGVAGSRSQRFVKQ